MRDLSGSVALVTGAGRGIGRAVSERLAQRGVDVVLTARTMSELEEAAGIIRNAGGNAECMAGDLTDSTFVDRLFNDVDERFGKLDILVNNAGGGVPPSKPDGLQPFTHEDEAFMDNLNLNLVSVWRATREVLPHMRDQGYGRIISITSPSGVLGFAGQANYAASKAGLVALTRSLACEVATRGITVNCLCPGFILTDLINDLPTEKLASFKKDIPMGRFGEPEEVAAAVLFLASRYASYISGATLGVTGGIPI